MRLLLSLAMVPLFACTSGDANDPDRIPATGTGTTRSFVVDGFTGVELRGADDVDVRVGPAFSVRAEGPSDQLDKLLIKKSASTLSVGHIGSFSSSDGSVKVFVTMPSIVAADVGGAGDLHVDVVGGDAFAAAVAGAGDLTVDALTSTSAKLNIAGSGSIAVKGTVQHLTVSVAGSGSVEGAGLTASGASVSVAGAGNVTATVNGAATVSIAGSGNVSLGAGATCTTNTLGSGTVKCSG